MASHGVPGTWPAGLTPATITRQPTISHPAVSPKGTRLAYLCEFDGRTDLWCGPVEGVARQVTTDQAAGDASYAWPPEGGEFVFTAAEDGKLRRCPATGGRATISIMNIGSIRAKDTVSGRSVT